jgi:DNA-binding transcriptional regulator LsrR (DeoR family)
MARIDEVRLITRVARMYHERGMRQPEIAERLRLSQPKVSRLLRQAIDIGIVRITVGVPAGAFVELEERLESRFGLQEAVVVDVDGDDEDEILRGLGAAAAFYVETTIRAREVVGLSSWSATLLAMVDAMHPISTARNARVVQILGGVGSPAAEGHATHLTRRFAELVRGEAAFLPAPGVVGSADAKRVLLDDPFVEAAMGLFDEVTLALVGIGAVQPSGLLASSGNVFSERELSSVREQGGVGDICLRFFDAAGKRLTTALDGRVIGMDLEQMKRMPRAVGVAGGRRKVPAIRGALEGRWINCLITDRFTAQALLDDLSVDQPREDLRSTSSEHAMARHS